MGEGGKNQSAPQGVKRATEASIMERGVVRGGEGCVGCMRVEERTIIVGVWGGILAVEVWSMFVVL